MVSNMHKKKASQNYNYCKSTYRKTSRCNQDLNVPN
jgi:hypothetical protein